MKPSAVQLMQFDTVCERIAGGMSLRRICQADDVPSIETIRKMLRDDASGELVAQYARAREYQADFYADDIIEIADTEEDPQRARVRIDARKWTAGKLRPKVYGDKQEMDVRVIPVTFTEDDAKL